MSEIVLEARHLKKVYNANSLNAFEALHDINIQVEKGEFIGVMGPSGSGKSTFINNISTIDTPTEGKVFINGKNVLSMSANDIGHFRYENLGFIFQDFNLLDTHTIYENIALPLSLAGVDSAEIETRVKEMAEKMDMQDHLYKLPSECSGGQRQRTAIARALINNPSIIIADEPTGNLDSQNSEELRQRLFAAEHLLGKPMTPSEVQKILYFHDTLAMSPDLIEFLVEYCVSKNHKSLRYMEKVALSWNEAGITTVAMAREQSSAFKSEYFSVLRFLGITGRSPVKDETAYIDRWLDQYGFDLELIREACSRTILKTGQPSFQYTDRILTDWHAQNVHTLGDIQNADETFRSTKKETAPPKKQPSASSRNRFNNFHQRQYDFQEYEKRLLSGQTVQGENGDT